MFSSVIGDTNNMKVQNYIAPLALTSYLKFKTVLKS